MNVELEHSKIRDANLTSNHPFLTAMVVIAHMSETLTYYKRLKVMEAEGEIFEITRTLNSQRKPDSKLLALLFETQQKLEEGQKELSKRLESLSEAPLIEEFED